MNRPAFKFLTVEPTVGYMLKVMKLGVKIVKYKDEFDAIRHGNYLDFLNLVKGPIPYMVVYKNGDITTDNTPTKNDCDFEGLLKAGPSLVIFYNNCIPEYGQIIDPDIDDSIYGKVVLFEISLRMHANNYNLLKEFEKLEHVIDQLGSFKQLTTEEIARLHQGRRFLNMIKHNKNQFPSWTEGISVFQDAYKVLDNNMLTVI